MTMLHMQTVVDRYEVPLKRDLKQLALTLETAGAGDPITELRIEYAPGLSIVWRDDGHERVNEPRTENR